MFIITIKKLNFKVFIILFSLSLKMELDSLDDFIICRIFNFLSQKDMVRLTAVSKRWLKLRDDIHHIITSMNMTDEQLLLYKNVNSLDCVSNQILTNESIKRLPLTKLICQHNNNFTDEGIKYLPLTHLDCGGCQFTDEVIKQLPLKELICSENIVLTDEGIKNLSLTRLDCGLNQNFTTEGIKNSSLIYLNIRANFIIYEH